MTNKSGNIGTKGETAVVRYARRNGFEDADRLTKTGNKDRGDVVLVKREVMVEVKAGHAAEQASVGQIEKWMREVEVETEHGDWTVAFLITKRKGAGYENPGSWWAHFYLSDLMYLRGVPYAMRENVERHDGLVRMTLDDALRQVRAAGYGLPLGSPKAS